MQRATKVQYRNGRILNFKRAQEEHRRAAMGQPVPRVGITLITLITLREQAADVFRQEMSAAAPHLRAALASYKTVRGLATDDKVSVMFKMMIEFAGSGERDMGA